MKKLKGFLSPLYMIFPMVFILFMSYGVNAQPELKFTALSGGLPEITDIRNAGDGSNRIFVAIKSGKIMIFKNGAVLSKPFLDITNIISFVDAKGLFSTAFDPDFINNRYFYVYYLDKSENLTLARYTASTTNPDSAELSSGVKLISYPNPINPPGHYGGQIQFDKDGYLYLTIGDGGTETNAQDGKLLFGKMIRLNVKNVTAAPYYTIPPDNPFVNTQDTLPEIYAFGLRNTWRWSFDSETGDMWIGDVGAGDWEEINFKSPTTAAGLNYGWPCYEGTSTYNSNGCNSNSTYTFPAYKYGHDNPNKYYSVTGGYVYRGSDYPVLLGYYVCGDFSEGSARLIKPSEDEGNWEAIVQKAEVPSSIISFGEDENGELYAGTISGTLYAISASNPLPVKLISFTAQEATAKGTVSLKWQTAFEQNVESFLVQMSKDARSFITVATVAAKNNANGFSYSFNHVTPSTGRLFYRLAIKSKDGTVEYSDVISITTQNNEAASFIYPAIVENNMVTLVLNSPFDKLAMFDLSGQMVMQKMLPGQTGSFNINLPKLAAGTYIMQLSGATTIRQKIIIK